MSLSRTLSRRRFVRDVASAGIGCLATSASAEALASRERAHRILILKSARKLILLKDQKVLHAFPVALGSRPVGPKSERGDGRTPEGRYRIDAFISQSRFYRALLISYPNAEDVLRARDAGVEPGGNIEIHGLPAHFGTYDPRRFYRDWTNGCIAVSNPAIGKIWRNVSVGTPVEIRA